MAGILKTGSGSGPVAVAFRSALAVTIPTLAGYLFLGSAYGILMGQIGYGPLWTVATSVIVFGGTIQFIATGLLAAGFQPLYAFAVSAMINARHLFYGFSMLERYAGTGWKKPLLVFMLTDETFSLLCSGDVPEGADPGWFRLFVSGLGYFYWIASSLLGNVAGFLFRFDTTGIEFVMTSLFAVIVLNQWRTARTHAPALVGLAASVPCLILFGPRYFIIPAMILIASVLMACRDRLEPDILREEEDELEHPEEGILP